MRKREEAEKARERELILSGKLTPDQGSFKDDKFFQLHKQMENINKQQGKKSVSAQRKPSTKARWQCMVHKMHITTDTQSDKGEEDITATTLPDDLEQYVVKVRQDNPIYDAFENASDVDDLYRIAESLVNSAFD